MNEEDTEANQEQSILLGRMLDINFEKADLEHEVNKLIHLTKFRKVILLSCLKLYKYIFGGNIGEWTGIPVDIPIKYKANPYH